MQNGVRSLWDAATDLGSGAVWLAGLGLSVLGSAALWVLNRVFETRAAAIEREKKLEAAMMGLKGAAREDVIGMGEQLHQHRMSLETTRDSVTTNTRVIGLVEDRVKGLDERGGMALMKANDRVDLHGERLAAMEARMEEFHKALDELPRLVWELKKIASKLGGEKAG